jgi:tRNA (guanine37-N1)-methyltransferase
MLKIDLISAVPSLLRSPLEESIIGRAAQKGVVSITIHDLHDYSLNKHKKVDDVPYGGGAGMVLTPQPIFDCVEQLQKESPADQVVFTSPSGKAFQQEDANRLSLSSHLIFLCGHYKGVDQRVRDSLVTEEFSIGDVVLSGGELPVLLMVDAIVRLLPGAIGDAESALTDSFQDGLLEGPVYTRPEEFRGQIVPDVLRSGNHEKIRAWRKEQAEKVTKDLRPDLYKTYIQNK